MRRNWKAILNGIALLLLFITGGLTYQNTWNTTERLIELKLEIQQLKEENANLKACVEILRKPHLPWEEVICPRFK
jgi:cell division protein FtsB